MKFAKITGVFMKFEKKIDWFLYETCKKKMNGFYMKFPEEVTGFYLKTPTKMTGFYRKFTKEMSGFYIKFA